MAVGITMVGRPEEVDGVLGRLVDRIGSATPDLRSSFVGGERAEVTLHPAAEPVRLSVTGLGLVVADAGTSQVGPGYHVFLVDLLRAAGSAAGIRWLTQGEVAATTQGSDHAEVYDEPGYLATGNAAAVAPEMAAWLRGLAGQLQQLVSEGVTELAVSLPMDVKYHYPAAVLTATGPRDLAWVAAAAREHVDGFFAWPNLARDARFHLGKALAIMWCDLAFLPGQQADLLAEVARELDAGYRLDPTLDWPWREWAEVLTLLGDPAWDPVAAFVEHQAGQVPADRPLIGYRRLPVTAYPDRSWQIDLPARSVGRWAPDGTTWQVEAARISLSLSMYSLEATGYPTVEAIHNPAGHRWSESEGNLRRSAEARAAAGDDGVAGHRYLLHGVVAGPGRFASLTVLLRDWADLDAALAVWRSLRFSTKSP